MNIFAANLSFLVKKTGKPATQVSKEMDVCNSTLHLYMHGVTSTRIEILRAICQYFDIEASKILFAAINDEVREEFDKLNGQKH